MIISHQPKTTKPCCPICLESYMDITRNGGIVVTTRCGHLFCADCLKKSIAQSGEKCPKCREKISKGIAGITRIFIDI